MIEPKCIRKLDEAVINRIAAGEVIQRPANALKELIENSIDAKSSAIQVNVTNGGLKLIQIIDNGTGIRREDFEIVCERFTTSKLEKFEDLSTINTYGFRGEALASISHVAHLTIQSKTAKQDCAYKASYIDSKLTSPPKPCAGNQGTIITIEDLFYNMATRKQVLKNANDEYRRIADVVGKYSIHNAGISFGLKKSGESCTLKTQMNSSVVDNIRTIYGDVIARELLPIEQKEETLKFSFKGYVSNANYSMKKSIFILFINHRLVDCGIIKKSLEQVYSTYLPKNAFPFIYLSLEIDSRNVDVNVHPTKHEVQFLHQEQIVEKIVHVVEAKFLGSNNSRVFYTQTKLFGIKENKINEIPDKKIESPKAVHPKNLVRTDSATQKLDKYLCPGPSSNNENGNTTILNMIPSQPVITKKREIKLTSIKELRKSIEDSCHLNLKDLFKEHVFVGCVNTKYSLIQHQTKLYLCNTPRIMEQLFYQIIIFNFQNFPAVQLKNPLALKQLVLMALELPEAGWTEEDGEKDDLADKAVELLTGKKDMLKDYFLLGFNAMGELLFIPELLDNHQPELAGLPMYLLRLATEVNWREEKECFETFAKETAAFYAHVEEANTEENVNWQWTTEHVLYPALKKSFFPPKQFTEQAIVLEIADLPNLYKVFERC